MYFSHFRILQVSIRLGISKNSINPHCIEHAVDILSKAVLLELEETVTYLLL
jgi:hypothetical protein